MTTTTIIINTDTDEATRSIRGHWREHATIGPTSAMQNYRWAPLFGHLADLAAPHLTNYRSDLYHDVRWLDRHAIECALTGEPFWFVVRASGTHIGTEANPARINRAMGAGSVKAAVLVSLAFDERDPSRIVATISEGD